MIIRELRILALHKGILLGSIAFYALALLCSSLALGSDINMLHKCGPALYWILAIMTTLFTLPPQIKQDENEGLLDEMIFQNSPLGLSLLLRSITESLMLGLPLIVTGLILSPLFHFELKETLTLILTLIIGYPALNSLGLLGGLLTLHSRGGGLLISLILLPLTIPLFLLSLSALEMVQLGLDSFPSFCLLIGVSLILTIVSLVAGTKALKLAVEG